MQNVLGFRLTVIASKNSRLVGAGLARTRASQDLRRNEDSELSNPCPQQPA